MLFPDLHRHRSFFRYRILGPAGSLHFCRDPSFQFLLHLGHQLRLLGRDVVILPGSACRS